MNLSNFERWWREFRKEAGFEGLRFHELRHTQATQLLANGVDLKTVQDRMGHANGAITLNWYAHAVPENDEKAAQLVGEIWVIGQIVLVASPSPSSKESSGGARSRRARPPIRSARRIALAATASPGR